MFGTVWPGTKFKLDANGRSVPAGHTVRYPAIVGFVTVTFNATDPTPDPGTPPRPVTVKLNVAPPTSAPPPSNCPSDVVAKARKAGTNIAANANATATRNSLNMSRPYPNATSRQFT